MGSVFNFIIEYQDCLAGIAFAILGLFIIVQHIQILSHIHALSKKAEPGCKRVLKCEKEIQYLTKKYYEAGRKGK